MINKKLIRPRIMSDAFSRNMNFGSILREIDSEESMGIDHEDAVEHAIKKHGRGPVEKALDVE